VLDFFSHQGITFYKKMAHKGYLRHLLVRRAAKTDEILINLVTSSQWDYEESEQEILEKFKTALLHLKLEGNIVGILHTYNDSLADVVQWDRLEVLYGKDYFYEELLGLKFKISSFS